MDEETELLTDHKDVREAAEALYSQGVKVVAVTLGGEGAYLYGKDGGCMVPGFAVKQIADTNGAGDSFWGGFLYKVSTAEKHLDELTQEDLKEFARFGNAVASLCVEKKGAIPAMPERRSEPSSRTALMGEQPNPWDLLQPQDAMSRHRGAKPLRRCDVSLFSTLT